MRQLAATLAAFVLVVPSESGAVFHISHIGEVMSGAGGDSTAQYVEIRMDAPAQNAIGNSILSAFDCDGTTRQELLVVPGNVTNAGANTRWIMATKTPIGGIAPDFVWDPTMTGNIPTPCGMVCWGAPGVAPPATGTWNHNDPNQYVDCVAYGGYTGPTKTSDPDADGITSSAGTPSTLAPGDGTLSLTRVKSTNDNAADFALDCPSPTNNAGAMGNFGPCTPPSTTSTTTLAGATTTTTTPTGGCTDIATCRTALTGVLPSPATAESAKARKAAVKIGKLATRAGKALDTAARVTGKKQQKQYRKARAALTKLLAKARAAAAAGTLAGPLAPLEAAVNALLAQIP